jgi:ApaG protein
MDQPYRIEVSVHSEYVEAQSQPEAQRFVFAYHVTIRNRGRHAAQLRSRHWVIVDGNGKVEEVQGLGVVGEQPAIAPDDEHRYDSFCVLETPVGAMHGHYRMIGEDGHAFDAEIPAFTLSVPGSLN